MSRVERVQLSRAKGWKMPPNTVKVDRTSPFGNPWRVADEHKWGNGWVVLDPEWAAGQRRHYWDGRVSAARFAVAQFRSWLESGFGPDLGPLRGKNLACWCKPGAPCHADVLLELANIPHLLEAGDE